MLSLFAQSANPLFRSMSESERRALFVEHFGHHPDASQANHTDLLELGAIRTARQAIGCNCHSMLKEVKKLTLKRLKEELALRQVCARVLLSASRVESGCGCVDVWMCGCRRVCVCGGGYVRMMELVLARCILVTCVSWCVPPYAAAYRWWAT